jgi:hypothetical protein
MDTKPQSQDELPPLDLEYAQFIVDNAPELERMKQMLPLVPPQLQKLVASQETAFLYGMVTMGQALHDLLGHDILLEVAEILRSHEDNKVAVGIASEAVRMVAMLEAIGYITCKEITNRAEKQQ